MSPDDSEFLEQEYQKPEEERKMIRIGHSQQFLVCDRDDAVWKL